jgi:hypothetical protein
MEPEYGSLAAGDTAIVVGWEAGNQNNPVRAIPARTMITTDGPSQRAFGARVFLSVGLGGTLRHFSLIERSGRKWTPTAVNDLHATAH